MSAIIAGESCVQCKQGYKTSFGHFKGYNKRTGNMFREYMILKRKGICLACHIRNEVERMEKGKEVELPLLSTVVAVALGGIKK